MEVKNSHFGSVGLYNITLCRPFIYSFHVELFVFRENVLSFLINLLINAVNLHLIFRIVYQNT